jgi:alkylhydroperoxidase/carboxymuconolactone decarboxylase family protein YurZ
MLLDKPIRWVYTSRAEVIIPFHADGRVRLREARGLTRAEIREALIVVRFQRGQPAALWELYC